METRLKCFSFIKIPSWLSAEFAETMFLLTGDLGIFDQAIGEDPVSHAIAQPNSAYRCKFKCFNELSYFLELKTLTSFLSPSCGITCLIRMQSVKSFCHTSSAQMKVSWRGRGLFHIKRSEGVIILFRVFLFSSWYF